MGISKSLNQKTDFESAVHHKINRFLSVIDIFKGTWNALEQTRSGYLKELRKIATIESVGSSTRIEGATLIDEEVENLLKSVKLSKLETRDEQEVAGYYEALEIILENYEEIPLSQNYIHQLHGIFLHS